MTKKNITLFTVTNFIIIVSNIISKVRYRDLLLETLPEFPYPFWQIIIKESFEAIIFTFLIFFSYPLYKEFKEKKVR